MGTYYNSHKSKRKNIKWTGVIVALAFSILFILLCVPVLTFVQKIVVGILGITAYPLSLLGVLIGVAIATNRKFSMKPKNIVYVVLTALFVVSLLHIIFSSSLINSYGKISFKNYGNYLKDSFSQTAGITVGGVVVSILFYPLVPMFGIVGACVVNSIILCVIIGFTVDYYLSKQNKTETKEIKNHRDISERSMGNGSIRSNADFGSYLSKTSTAQLKASDNMYSEFFERDKKNNNNLFDDSIYKEETKTPEKIVEDNTMNNQNSQNFNFSEYARNTLYGKGNIESKKFSDDENSLLVDDKAQMGYDPAKYSSLKEYIKYPYVPPVFIKAADERQNTIRQTDSQEQSDKSGLSRIQEGLERIKNQNQERKQDLEKFVEEPFDLSVREEVPKEEKRSLPHTNPFNIDDLKIKNTDEDIFDDDRELNNRINIRDNVSPDSKMGEQLFSSHSDLQRERNTNDFSERRQNSNEFTARKKDDFSNFNEFDRNQVNNEFIIESDNFDRRQTGVRGKDLTQRKTPERKSREDIFTNSGLRNQPRQIFTPQTNYVNDNINHKPKIEQIELPVSKSPFAQKGETDARYIAPPTTILANNSDDPSKYGGDFAEKSERLEEVLDSFKIPAKVIGVIKGPTVTKFELGMPVGIPVKKVLSYDGDIAMALMSKNGVRIEAPILGKNAVGVEIPNDIRCVVGLREILESKEFQNSTAILPVAIGKNIYGETVVTSMAKMIHLLVAGSTGSGKTVFLHNLILSLMYKSSPDQLRFIMIDPKRVEFAIYNGMPHLMLPNVVTECDKAINAFTWAVKEMDRRYKVFQQCQTPNIELFNKCDAVKNGEEKKVPYIVIIVDELADLMLVGKREVESKIQRLAQLGRACGIFLVIATQRPSVEVVTGTIKSNLPTRVAFSLASFVDSRTILDEAGAEKLLGKGDMLYSPQDASVASRLQAAYVETTDIKKVIDYIKDNNDIYFDEEIEQSIMSSKEDEDKQGEKLQGDESGSEYDEILPQVLKFFIESNTASTSMIQRRFKVGYARAARILDEMEVAGFVSPANGSKARSVYMTIEQYENMFGMDDN